MSADSHSPQNSCWVPPRARCRKQRSGAMPQCCAVPRGRPARAPARRACEVCVRSRLHTRREGQRVKYSGYGLALTLFSLFTLAALRSGWLMTTRSYTSHPRLPLEGAASDGTTQKTVPSGRSLQE